MDIAEFKKFLNDSVKKGVITSQERDNYYYDCALAQLENTNITYLLKKIVKEVNERK